ncbi:MAG: hypothetical protein LBO66_05750 [Deltaproteobacteria bacterium]|jgi:hypothetical protein|nr:hypothetical protein [Deltaproteobacteria bacterium]
MEPVFFQTLALTATEWLHWVASGHIRYVDRIRQIMGVDDFSGFASLMDSAPSINYRDDGGFVIAKLKSNWTEFQQILDSPSRDRVIWLRIEGVETFFPVSERGARLLNGEARRARVALGDPIFQNLWDEWVSSQTLLRERWRGETLAKTLDFPNPNIDRLPQEITPFLLGDNALPYAQNLQKLSASPAFGWASAFSLFGNLVGEREISVQSDRLHLTDIISKLRDGGSIRTPILYESAHLSVAAALSDAISATNKSLKVSVKFLVVVFHYLGLLDADRDIELESLVKDLAALVEANDASLAANAAYLIGRKMEDIQVTSLYYAKFSNLFPSLSKNENLIIPNWRAFAKITQETTEIPQNNPDPEATASPHGPKTPVEPPKGPEPETPASPHGPKTPVEPPKGPEPETPASPHVPKTPVEPPKDPETETKTSGGKGPDKRHKDGKSEPKTSGGKRHDKGRKHGKPPSKASGAEKIHSNRLFSSEQIPTEESTAIAKDAPKGQNTPLNNKTNRK